ncbi:MAG: hypothetical protein ACSHYF_02275 [Verrucomicrobiaceae bacterium]
MAKQDIEDFVKSRPPLFWWLLANILAIAFAITAWVVCLNLFRDPTHPTSYKLMMKVGRIHPLEQFDPTTAPAPRKSAGALELEEEYRRFDDDDLRRLNHELKRAYLVNYVKSRKFLTYVRGEFRIISSRPLTPDDFLPSGVVVRAQAMVKPDDLGESLAYPVFIECLFPAIDYPADPFTPGDLLVLKKIPDCAAILNVGNLEFDGDSALYLTLVPLCAVDYVLPSGETITISPPEMANVSAALPVMR